LSPQCADLVVSGPAAVRGWPGAGPLWWKELWSRTSPAIGSGGRAYFLTWDDGDWLEARDQDGERAWRLALSHHAVVPPAIGRGPGGDTDSGIECERREAPGPGVRVRDHRADDEIYVSDVDGFLNAVDSQGRLRWRRPFGNGVSSAPIVIELQNGDQQIIVVNDNTLWSFSRDGVPTWYVSLDSPARGSPAVANGRIFVTTETSLYAIGPPRPRGGVVITQPEKPDEGDRLVAPTVTPTSTPGPRPTATSTPETRTIVDPARLTPDLSVERVSVRPSGAAATGDCDPGSNTITAVIKNGGSAPAGTFTVRLRIDGREPGDNRRTIGELAAGEETIASFPSVPLSQGTRSVEVSVDPENRVAERDETNNLKTLQVACQHEVS
jgi:hypothetical protein